MFQWRTPTTRITPITPPIKTKHKTESSEHLIKRLKTNHLLQDTKDIVLNECKSEILQLFSIKELLLCITRNTTSNKLQSIYEIIKKHRNISNKLKNGDIDNNDDDEEDDDFDDDFDDDDDDDVDIDDDKLNRSLISLPNECMGHICGYLNRLSICSLKLVSRQIGIVCLQEMNKVSIGILNGHNLDSIKYLKNTRFHHRIENRSRYNAKKKFYSLFEDLERKYDIPQQNQLIFDIQRNGAKLVLNTNDIKLNIIMKNKSFLIYDYRKFVILNERNVRKFDIEIDRFDKLKNYTLMVLEYFNINTDQTNIAQFILYEKGKISFERILRYIQYEFILIDGVDNNWYYELKKDLKKVIYCTKLCIGHNPSFNPNGHYYCFQIFTPKLTALQIVFKQRKQRYIKVYRRRITRIYATKNPQKLNKIDEFINRCTQGQSDEDKLHALYSKICNKYQLIPLYKYDGQTGTNEPDENEIEQDMP